MGPVGPGDILNWWSGRLRANTFSQDPTMPGILILFSIFGLQLAAASADNLGLLSGTLKTYQRAACDEETMSLRCPPGTTISITFARYGRVNDATEKCISNKLHPSSASSSSSTSVNETCLLTHELQYSLLQNVVEICQKKRSCKFNTNPKNFQYDRCPHLPKYTEVAYKCRPYEFRSKISCEHDAVNLVCYPGKRVAILSASFGRTEYESLQCPQPHGVKEETCTTPHATEIVIQLCHGKRKCSVTANGTTFGDSCKPDTRPYLKIIYTCVPRGVLQEQFVGDIESDEVDLVPEFDEGFDRTDFKTEFSPSPNLENPEPPLRNNNETIDATTVDSTLPRARTNNDIAEEDLAMVGYLNEWINAYSFITRNQEKFYLYIIVSVAGGVMLFLGLVIGRLLISRHRAKRDTKFQENNETLPNGFNDEISEIDADIDLSTPVPVPMPETRIPETQLAERLHGTERYYTDSRMPLPMMVTSGVGVGGLGVGGGPVGGMGGVGVGVGGGMNCGVGVPMHHQMPIHHPGVRVDLGNHMIGADSLHTILSTENLRNIPTNKSYYYG
ncbi:protein eva-1 isoform X1 [Cotesia glomerata]|uniref:protein eva-1 isoform X1 n=1 Tax=Cotesia glomerata TaxID=32391 RepID=UPI001D01F7D5|nr:protein eva-1 isoform X1 [Cotesia glomerata]XP_044590797.1 protein eva-1 isoform X1 [Cotesia glomerata]XP_044590798.1 protein eva-1 isoform X1 [Cotesia glomerata]